VTWTEVPSPSLVINELPSTIQNELQEAKNKVFKPQGAKKYFNPKKNNSYIKQKPNKVQSIVVH
jgi:hypothetical protein